MVKLGDHESLHCEFKSAAALKSPEVIARGVVAFLNSDGGSLWVGVGEDEQGRAKTFEPIPDVEAELQRLQNLLVDTIEPSPILGHDVKIEIEARQGKDGLLRLTVLRGGGKQAPYALLDKGRRGYHTRTGSRTRFMTREELAASFSDAAVDQSKPAKAREQVEATMIDWIGGPAGLRVLVRPVEPIEVEIATLDLYSLLVDASKTGNREVGWTFVNPAGVLKPINPRGWRFGKRGDVQWLELFTETGQLEFWVSRERLHWRGNASELWPTCVLELPTSIMRLARTLYSDHHEGKAHPDVVLGLGLYGIGDCTLRPHSPESIGYLMPRTAVEPLQQLVDRDYFASTPVTVSWDELAATPDRCAFHLVAQLYRDFGYDEDQLPREFNRQTGQLVFPR